MTECALQCDYLWRSILKHIGNKDRVSVALTCRQFRRLAHWVDPIRTLWMHALPTQDLRLAREIFEFNSELFTAERISISLSLVEAFYVLHGAVNVQFYALFDSVTYHAEFVNIMRNIYNELHVFRKLEKHNDYALVAEHVCQNLTLVSRLLHSWSTKEAKIDFNLSIAIDHLHQFVGQVQCADTIACLLERALLLGKVQLPDRPEFSHVYQNAVENLLIGSFFQSNPIRIAEILSHLVELSNKTESNCFYIAARTRNWTAFQTLLHYIGPARSMDAFFTMLDIHMDAVRDDFRGFINCFVAERDGLLEQRMFLWFISRSVIAYTRLGVDSALSQIYDSLVDAVSDGVHHLCRTETHNTSAYKVLQLLVAFIKYGTVGQPSDYELLHDLFHVIEPLLIERNDWIDFLRIDFIKDRTDIASECICAWAERRLSSIPAVGKDALEQPSKRLRRSSR